MIQRKEVLTIGIFALVLALLLRLVSATGALPLQNSHILSFLV